MLLFLTCRISSHKGGRRKRVRELEPVLNSGSSARVTINQSFLSSPPFLQISSFCLIAKLEREWSKDLKLHFFSLQCKIKWNEPDGTKLLIRVSNGARESWAVIKTKISIPFTNGRNMAYANGIFSYMLYYMFFSPFWHLNPSPPPSTPASCCRYRISTSVQLEVLPRTCMGHIVCATRHRLLIKVSARQTEQPGQVKKGDWNHMGLFKDIKWKKSGNIEIKWNLCLISFLIFRPVSIDFILGTDWCHLFSSTTCGNQKNWMKYFFVFLLISFCFFGFFSFFIFEWFH